MGEPDEPNPANESTQEVTTEEEKAEEQRVIEQGKVEDAKSRSIFDRDEMTLGYSRQRATDMKMNTRVIFPGAMSNEEESKLQVARTSHIGDLSEMIVTKMAVMPTDKSGRFAIMDMECYILSGEKHTRNDDVVSMDDVKENQADLNGSILMLLKIFMIGQYWGHESRARGTMICNSLTVADLYLLVGLGQQVVNPLADLLLLATEDRTSTCLRYSPT
jgi:hypothetical protein